MNHKNQNSFGVAGILVGVLVLAAIGGVGFYVLKNKDQDKKAVVSTVTPNVAADITKNWATVASKDAAHPFEVKVPKALLPQATCITDKILLAVI